jgi:hypothetical protein
MIAEDMITVRLTPPFRHVRMYQSHPAQVTPSWYGIPLATTKVTRW